MNSDSQNRLNFEVDDPVDGLHGHVSDLDSPDTSSESAAKSRSLDVDA